MTLPRTPGYATVPEALPRSSGGWERPPEALPKKLDDRDLATSITYTTYYCPLLLIIDYCYLELCTTTLHYYLSLIIVTSSYVPLHYDKYFDTQRPTVLSGQQLPSAVALPLLRLWIICSTWLSRPPSPHNFGWWWSRESGGPDYAGKWRPTYWRPTALCCCPKQQQPHQYTWACPALRKCGALLRFNLKSKVLHE